MLSYFTPKKSESADQKSEHKNHYESHPGQHLAQRLHDGQKPPIDEEPVLNEEDEAFLTHITSQPEGTPPQLPERPSTSDAVANAQRSTDAQYILMHGAQDVPLPDVPGTPEDVMAGIEGEQDERLKSKKKASRPGWSWLRRDSRDARRQDTALGLQAVAEGLKAPDAKPNEDGQVAPQEAAKEEDEMRGALENLNLAAVNNRVFSVSQESKDLMHKYVDTTPW